MRQSKRCLTRGVLGCLSVLLLWPRASVGQTVLIEAEGFNRRGGWVVDQQFMDPMGSPFLLAHGLGVPVEDAVTDIEIPSAGEYRVFVRTRDWVASWGAPGAPGRFQLLVAGRSLGTVFGAEGAEWRWRDGGMAELIRDCFFRAIYGN